MMNRQDNKTESPDLATPSRALDPVNVKYIGRARWSKDKRKRLDVNAPIEQFSDRGRIVELPSPSFQERHRKFYSDDAALIVQVFPHLYKKIVSK